MVDKSFGFTLVETLIALVVFAILAVVVYGRLGSVAMQSRNLEDRIFASWIAGNKLAELKISAAEGSTADIVIPSKTTEPILFARRTWMIEVRMEPTADILLSRAEINVYQGEEKRQIGYLTGFLPVPVSTDGLP